MSVSFKLPDVGEGIHEAEVVRWLVREGDIVREFDPLVEVQTDKALVELPAPASGCVREIKAKAGELARVGEVLVVIGDEASPAATRRVRATPATRKYARDLGIDISQVPASGPAGRVTREDVQAFSRQIEGRAVGSSAPAATAHTFQSATTQAQVASRSSPSPQENSTDIATPAPKLELNPEPNQKPNEAVQVTASPARPAQSVNATDTPSAAITRIPLRGLRRTIADRMTKAAFTAPHVTAVDEVDMTELVALRRQANELLAPTLTKITYLPFILKALTTALQAHPFLNAHMDDEAGEIVLHSDYNIGIAVDTEDGLIVPVIKQADRKSLLELTAELKQLTAQTKTRTLARDDLSGGTFTLSNMGPIGGLFATPILNYPQVGILGVHALQEKAVVRDGAIVIRNMMHLSLSFDHRVIDGAEAVRFTNKIKQLLETPQRLFLEMR
ncbi:hypothetical protein CIG75_18070 [Tumebacillus algifaecis]|uniref:Dihydrolipoamide acetyltransferase component of pyruvate dehydrogenase complex n=1 Tax=Tumebacillus algifaecis TaxID=1214604 RepID=A0A223D4Z6_9BACL|nr:dihydrolipoamide acetyltransferase family protein [Tumebacillus algifaecis]ASS76688.1 hypothetical protein CIG75_18070 [Tumebacillus algifaecis]